MEVQAPPEPKPRRTFTPYNDNGGSVVAIAGDDFAVIGADTRLSTGYSIFTRGQKRLFRLTDKMVLGVTGCWCDALALTRLLSARIQMYLYEHNKTMSTPAAAQMLSTVLYYKRFFPYVVNSVLAGLDDDGKGCVYSYDYVGHCESSKFCAAGSSGAQLQPLLDNQIAMSNQQNAIETPITQERAVTLLKDSFIGAAERDMYTGDYIYILKITANGIQEEKFELRKD
ncbi:hypothetical protein O0L34_g18162 [Tuta absoluta]|nr:hypothetical protein O0L34_g18162 [Tuta absoluta]